MWFRHEEKPGLAMTRSIGDHESRKIGVICHPQIEIRELSKNDLAFVIGSDGLFQYLEKSKTAQIV